MRIGSKFRDYYDGCASFDDTDSQWFREAKLLAVPKNDSVPPEWHIYSSYLQGFCTDAGICNNRHMNFANGIVMFFCGKFYFGLRVYKFKQTDSSSWTINQENFVEDSTYSCLPVSITGSTVVCWDKEKFSEVMSQKEYKWFTLTEEEKKQIDQWFGLNKSQNHKYVFLQDIAIKEKQPIIAIERVLWESKWRRKWDDKTANNTDIVECIIQNPMLKTMDFQTVVDPYTAFQEIEMYVTGVIQHPDPVILEVSDCQRAQQHGFNEQSFRGGKPKEKHAWAREKRSNTNRPSHCKN